MVSDDVESLRFTIWRSCKVPKGIWDSLALYYVNANLWAYANTLVWRLNMHPLTQCLEIFQWSGTWDREALLLSSHVSAPLQEFLQVEEFIPHTLDVSGTCNIKYHKRTIFFFYMKRLKSRWTCLAYTAMIIWLLEAA